jgi:hypothetical protein
MFIPVSIVALLVSKIQNKNNNIFFIHFLACYVKDQKYNGFYFSLIYLPAILGFELEGSHLLGRCSTT